MDRRRFLKVAGIAGLSVMAPMVARHKEASAGAQGYQGPFWIMVNASGGWDPTMLCDPKGGVSGMASSVDQAYTPAQIGTAGAISYAPTVYSSNGVQVYSAQQFFEANHARLRVINGVDTQTNNHEAGSETMWSGDLASGYPSFAAMVAATVSGVTPVPLPYMSYGGYDATAGIISLSRVGSPAALERLAFTNDSDPTNPTSDKYHTANTAARIQAAQQARVQSLSAKQSLPKVAASMGSLYLARQADGGLSALGNALKGVTLVQASDFPDIASQANNLGDLTNLMQQAQLSLLSFKSGVAVTSNINYGGFDTHSNNDTQQTRQLMILMRGLDYLFSQIDAMGLTNQVYVVVGSDFARTPYYNAGNGKDHWNITSMMFAGPKIAGDKVLGGTDAGQVSIPIDPNTLMPSASGERITTTNVHIALRKLAGITGGTLDQEFGLPGDTMPLFS